MSTSGSRNRSREWPAARSGSAMGVAGVILSLVFVGRKIVETSAEVRGLEFLGAYGSAGLTVVAVVAYVPVATFVATKLGAVLQRLDNRMQWAEGSYRSELNTLLHRSFHVAAARGEEVQKEIHKRRYLDIDQTWAGLNMLTAAYMGVRTRLQLLRLEDRRLRAGAAALSGRGDQPPGLHHRRGTGQRPHQQLLLVHPRDAEHRHVEGECAAHDRPGECGRGCAAAARVLRPHRPFRAVPTRGRSRISA